MAKTKSPAATKAPKQPKPKQGHLPGLEPPRIKAIDDAAETYFEVMTDRCKLSKEEDEAKDNLIDCMLKAGQTRYVTADGLTVDVTNKSNVKVKRRKDVSANGDEEGGNDEE